MSMGQAAREPRAQRHTGCNATLRNATQREAQRKAYLSTGSPLSEAFDRLGHGCDGRIASFQCCMYVCFLAPHRDGDRRCAGQETPFLPASGPTALGPGRRG